MRFLLLPFYGNYLKLKYHLVIENRDAVLPFQGPAVVFANHAHTLDPFFISAVYPYHIRWVAGSYLFKMRMVGYLLRKWVGCIPKTQGRNDLQTIRNISEALKKGDIVGVFPEGTRTWDGDMMDIASGTAKLVRLFKVPVVFIHIRGGFSSRPRWAARERKGPVTVEVFKTFTPEEISSMDKAELEKAVSECLSFSNDGWQEKAHVPYLGRKRAEGVESLLYQCPSCKSYSTIKAEGDVISCTACGASVVLDDYDRLVEGRGIDFSKLSEWHGFEKEKLASLLSSHENGLLFPPDRGILFQKGSAGSLIDLSKAFVLSCDAKGLHFSFPKPLAGYGDSLDFDFSSISSMVINAKQTIEFFYQGNMFRFRLKRGSSPLKIWELYNLVQARG